MESDIQGKSYTPMNMDEEMSFEFTSNESKQRELAYARTTIGITMRAEGSCRVEENCYGAALLIPQLARTVGYNKSFSILTMRTWFFLFLNIFLQAYLLKMISKEESVMEKFGGQMYLCDFGASKNDCPGPGCHRGPYGTNITAARLYNWEAIVNRNFVKDSLKALFPEKIKEINKKVDPGEYGMEDYWCRFTCCFIFMVTTTGEFYSIVKMLRLLYKIPTEPEPWIKPKPKTEDNEMGAIGSVTVTIAGMPLFWKIINLVFVVLPKLGLWKLTNETGITFLMETSTINDLIINSVGLTFILALDELMISSLMSEETVNFVRAAEEFALYDVSTSCVGDMSSLSDDEILSRYKEQQQSFKHVGIKDLVELLPDKFIVSVLFTVVSVGEYYWKHCIFDMQDSYHQLVSQPVYLPASLSFDWENAILPLFFKVKEEKDPYWTMPQ